MRGWLPLVLTLPFALAGCPALLDDWSIRADRKEGDASAGGGDAGGSSGSGGNGGSSGSNGGTSSGGAGGTGRTSAGGSSGADGGADADAASPTVYNDVTDPSFWSLFDTTTLNANAQGFFGGAFDGRYVYFVPSSRTVAVRYDARAGFAITGSWQAFDTAEINTSPVGYRGGAFDGRYVYLVPFANGSVGSGVVAQFDTQVGFADSASWTTFDTTAVDAAAEGFNGAVFDGRYLYLVPHFNTGTVARYDTFAPFRSPSSWTTFDATTVHPNAQGFLGGVFDGRHVYFVPNGAGQPLVRYDTQGIFTSGAAWATFDTTLVDAAAQSFLGAAFDGKHLYLAPFPAGVPGGTAGTIALRFDPAGDLASPSFAGFTVSNLAGSPTNFAGTAFDGRFVYFAPWHSSVEPGIVQRARGRRIEIEAMGHRRDKRPVVLGGDELSQLRRESARSLAACRACSAAWRPHSRSSRGRSPRSRSSRSCSGQRTRGASRPSSPDWHRRPSGTSARRPGR